MRSDQPFNLLVIEDNIGDFILLQAYLDQSGLNIEKVYHANNMASVPSLVSDLRIDIVLLDLSLPDSAGVDSVITLDRMLPNTPIVVFSGLSTIEIAIEAISLGAQDYLVKGEFDAKLLAKSIHYSIERKRTIVKLRESNERYELVNKATHDTIWEWDMMTNNTNWNYGLSNIFGYRDEGIINKFEWWSDNIHAEDHERVLDKLNQAILDKDRFWEDEYRFRCGDGSYKDVFDRGHILFDEAGTPFRMIGAMTDITERKRLEQELLVQQLAQQKLITEITIRAQEKERNELGRELHDNINQILATVKMYLGMIQSGKSANNGLLSKSYDYVDNAMAEIRKLSHTLVAPSLGDIGLKEALEELADQTNNLDKLRLKVNVDDTYKPIDKNKELMLYRIVQEQLSNIIKYAKASEIIVQLKAENDKLFLSVTDDGVGFDPDQKANGIGLKNISSRVDFYAGQMNISTAPGKGCTLEVYLPV